LKNEKYARTQRYGIKKQGKKERNKKKQGKKERKEGNKEEEETSIAKQLTKIAVGKVCAKRPSESRRYIYIYI
jgi:hypothetical protein